MCCCTERWRLRRPRPSPVDMRGAAASTRRSSHLPRPLPVSEDSTMQAAVRASRTVFPEDRSWVGQRRQVQVELLMANLVLLADVLGITPGAPDTQPQPVDTPDLEALRARLKQLPKATLEAMCPSVSSSSAFSLNHPIKISRHWLAIKSGFCRDCSSCWRARWRLLASVGGCLGSPPRS